MNKTHTPSSLHAAGRPIPLVDGIEKVTGKAIYTGALDLREAVELTKKK